MGCSFVITGVVERGPRMSYSGFYNFRMHLMHLCGYEGDDYAEGLDVVKTNDRDLYLFLNHSDCDGSWDPGECDRIADALVGYSDKIKDEWHDTLYSFIDLFNSATTSSFSRVEIF